MATSDTEPNVGLLDLAGLSLRDVDSLAGTVLAGALDRALAADQADISGFSSYVGPRAGTGAKDDV